MILNKLVLKIPQRAKILVRYIMFTLKKISARTALILKSWNTVVCYALVYCSCTVLIIIPEMSWYYCRAFYLVRQGKIVLHTRELDETAKQK